MLSKIADQQFQQAKTRRPGTYRARDKQRTESGYYHRRDSNRKANIRAMCVDGEGYTNPSEEHIYFYIAASNSDATDIRERYNPDGLSTAECLDFLLSLPPQTIKVGFSFDYDINMMLRDLNIFQLMLLYEKGFVKWKGYRINWTPRKRFSVARSSRKYGKKKCTIWDIYGYFQTSFVKTIWKWQVGTDDELRTISRMKESRSQFTIAQIAEISSYCRLECKLGSQVFEKLLQNTRAVGLSLRRYDGAGSVAAAMLAKHDVQNYMHQTIRLSDEVICAGYYGGRFDLTAYGECGNAFQYDINSAYPYQAVSLPCLSCGSWEYSRNYDSSQKWAIWHVSWNIDKHHLWSPFPYRHSGHIYYLRNGSGWYWSNEVLQAIALYPDSISVREGYIFHQACSHQPFSFITDYFQRRRRLKEQGDLAEMVLKLGMNSVYGKLAQNAGRTIPKTQCLIWAGIITSNTRAMLLGAIKMAPNDTLLLATDATISRMEIPLSIGTNLGEWERSYLQSLFIITNGVYQARGTKEDKHATRGISLKDLYDPDNNINHWAVIRHQAVSSNRFTYSVDTKTFVGLGRALSSNPVLNNWRQWIVEPYHLNYGKFDHKEFREGRLYPSENLWGELESQPYDPSNYRQDEAPLLQILNEESPSI